MWLEKNKTCMRELSFPLFFTVLYICITFLISIAMPVVYTDYAYDYLPVMGFLLLVCISISVGYNFGVQSKTKYKRLKVFTYQVNEQICVFFSIVSVASLLIELIFLISVGHFNPTDIVSMYIQKLHSESNYVVYLVRFLCAPLRVGTICIGIFRYMDSSARMKFLVVCNAILFLMVFLFGYGVQSGISDLLIYGVVGAVSYMVHKKYKTRPMIFICLLASVICVFVFSFILYKRLEYSGWTIYNYTYNNISYNTDSPFFIFFGEKIGLGMACLMDQYMSQGYYGLSLCLKLPFSWTYGVGNSIALMRVFEKICSIDVFPRTYLARMEETYGRSAIGTWNTIFPWLASDFTWLGTVIFMGLVGYVMARSWKETIQNGNSISLMVVAICLKLVIFIPANNQIFHGFDNFITTCFYFGLWFLGKDASINEADSI